MNSSSDARNPVELLVEDYFVMQFIAGLGLDVVLAEVRELRDRSAPPPGK